LPRVSIPLNQAGECSNGVSPVSQRTLGQLPGAKGGEMLKIIFGHDLDGYESSKPFHALGDVILGPLGFLDVLEVRLGLRGALEKEPVRIIQFLDCLHQADDGNRFYSRSLSTDEMAVARTLLRWRDTWIEAGWNSQARASDSKRIRDLADVEAHSKSILSPGTSDRLVAVLDALKKKKLTGLRVELKDPRGNFSYTWQEILNQLGAVDDQPEFLGSVSAPKGSDLALLQEAIQKNEPVKLQGDGTVLFLSAYNEGLLARGIAQILHGQIKADENSWFRESLKASVVNGGGVHALDFALEGGDLPVTGSSMLSRWRPPLQVLSLAISLLWDPVDPHRLLEFLTHPVCPLPRFARYHLAEVVAEFPGIGGKPWAEAIIELKAQAIERASGESGAGDNLAATVNDWLEGECFSADEGAPVSYVSEKCAKLTRWAAAQAEREGIDPSLKALFFSASAQASQAQKTLDQMMRSGRDRIGKLQLERLIDQITSLGVSLPGATAEIGHSHLICSASSTIEPNERVLWWNFSEPLLPARWPWNSTELKQLAENGAYLPPVESQLQLLSKAWLRPLFAATKQILFTVPRTSEKQAVRHHPLRARLDALTDGTIPELDMGALLTENNIDPRLTLSLDSVPHKGLPLPTRWWKLENPQLLSPRKTESFSSLQSFIESPYQWVMRYKGRLYPATLARIDDGNRQKGNLLHRFIERLFDSSEIDWQTSTRHELAQWTDGEFQKLLEEEGANYLLPGKLKDRQELAETTDRTIWTLVEHLRSANVSKVEIEKEVQGSFIGGNLIGSIDMLLTNVKGEEFVLDLKLGGGKYRQKELQENQSLQLALYAYLRKIGNKWPAQGYYILNDARLLAQDTLFFPNTESCPPPDGETDASLWLSFEKAWKWRRSQLDKGLIELTVEGTEPDESSIPPEGALSISDFNDRFNDFSALTGWKEGA